MSTMALSAAKRLRVWSDAGFTAPPRAGAFAVATLAAVLTSGTPALAGPAAGMEGLGAPSDDCFDNVAIVLNDKPSRTQVPPAASKAGPAADPGDGLPPPDDAHPVLTLFLRQPRPCAAYPDIAALVTGADSAAVLAPTDPWATAARRPVVTPASSSAWATADGLRFPPSHSRPPAEALGYPADLEPAHGLAFAGFASRAPRAQAGQRGSPPSFASDAAEGLGHSPLQDRPGADPPVAPPELTGPAPTSGPLGPAPGVPEPSTWLLLIAGVFGIGASLRRRTLHLAV